MDEIKAALDLLATYLEEVGECDHSVGLCICGEHDVLYRAEVALAAVREACGSAVDPYLSVRRTVFMWLVSRSSPIQESDLTVDEVCEFIKEAAKYIRANR